MDGAYPLQEVRAWPKLLDPGLPWRDVRWKRLGIHQCLVAEVRELPQQSRRRVRRLCALERGHLGEGTLAVA